MLTFAACAPAARGGGISPAVRPALEQTVYLVKREPGKGWLGIRFTADERLADPSKPGARHVRVIQVVPDTPAHRSGLRSGDILLRYRDEEVTFRAFPDRISGTTPGTAAVLAVRRGDKELELTAVIGDRRDAPMALRMSGSLLGMRLVPAERIAPGSPRRGLLVEKVSPGSPAARAGVQPGAFVIAAQNAPVDTAEGLQATIAAQPPGARFVLTTVESDGRLDFYVLVSRQTAR